MKSSRLFIVGLVFAAIVAGLAAKSSTVPVFARKYGFSCTMCHSNAPRLNDFGTRYRQNGYRLPGREHDEKTVLESPPPIALRASGGYTYEKFTNVPDATSTSRFQMSGLDLLSAGLLGSRIGYMMVYTPHITGSRGVEPQEGALEMASVVFSRLGSPWINVRAGRFEPAYAAFSVKRRLSITPYDIYDYGAPGGVVFSETQTGIEVTGSGPGFGRGWRVGYATGCVNGSETARSDDVPADFYVRATGVFGQGEGQTAGQRIGVTGYFGSARPDTAEVAPESYCRQSFVRVGVDASFNVKIVNLALQYIFGKDDKSLWGFSEDPDFWGGFAELSLMPRTDFVAFGRFDMVNMPKTIDEEFTRITGGARYYFADNLALHFEYSRRQEDSKTTDKDPVQNSLWARLDIIF
jgi:hypothetical protein